MFGKKKPEVLVAGAGPVGLFAAAMLARRGVPVQVVDKEWRTGAHSYALALHAESLKLFGELGVLDELLQNAYRVRSIGLYDSEARRREIVLAETESDPGAIAVLQQDGLEGLLEDSLRKLGVNVLWNHEVSQLELGENAVSVTIDKLEKESVGYATAHTEWMIAKSIELETPFVIGADGHRSAVRRFLGLDFDEVGESQHFAVFEFKTDADLQNELRIVMSEGSTSAVWPLPNGYCRWSFQLDDFSAPEVSRLKDRLSVQLGPARYPVLSEDSLRDMLAQRAPWFEGSIENVEWRIVVRFERRMASAFGKERVWLAGDAGHMTGPVGMQSMNVEIREAVDLVDALMEIREGGGSLERLHAYNDERLAEWRFLLGLERGPRAGETTEPWVAQRSDRFLPCIPASGEPLQQLLAQLGLEAAS